MKRDSFLIALGSTSLAACSAGGKSILLPSKIVSTSGATVDLPQIAFARLSSQVVGCSVNGESWFQMSYDATGMTTIVGAQSLHTPWPRSLPTTSTPVTDGNGRTIALAGPKSYQATSAEGKQLLVKSVETRKTLFSFTAPSAVSFILPHDIFWHYSALRASSSYSLTPRGSNTLTRSAQDIVCTSYASFYQAGSGGGGGTWYITDICTGTNAQATTSTTAAQGGGGYDPSNPTNLSTCLYSALLALGIFQVTALTEATFVTAMAAALAGIALTGVGAIAEAIAIVVGVLLLLGIAALDDALLQTVLQSCGLSS